MLGFGVSTAPFVRQALLTRVVDNDDILRTIAKPVRITHGALDAVVRTMPRGSTSVSMRSVTRLRATASRMR